MRASRSPCAVALELRRRQRLDLPVDAHAHAAQDAQREVVRGEPLEIAGQRPREPEEAHPDDGHRQRQDRRALGGARDQVPRGGHEPRPEDDREGAERGGERGPRARRVREGEQAAQGRGHAAHRAGTATAAPASSRTMRSACATTSGRWAMSSTVRPAPSRCDGAAHVLHAGGIEIGRRLVEDDERRIAQERARQPDPPALARRQRAPAVAHERPVAAGQRADEGVGTGERGGGAHRAVGRRPPEPDVVGDAAAHERGVLGHPRDERAPVLGPAAREVDAADGDAAGRRLQEPEQQRRHGALAGAALAHERHGLAGRQLEVEPVEDAARRAPGRRRRRAPGAPAPPRGSGPAAALPREPRPARRAARASGRRPPGRRRSRGTPRPAGAAAGTARARARARSARPRGPARRRPAARRPSPPRARRRGWRPARAPSPRGT